MILSEDKKGLKSCIPEWAACLSEQSISSGTHYYEILIETLGKEEIVFGVAALSYKNLTDWYDSDAQSIIYHANGKIWRRSDEICSWQKWKEGDRIGLLLDMDKQTICFYKNRERMEKEPIELKLDEVKLVAALNGVNKVTLLEEQLPEELALLLKPPLDEQGPTSAQNDPSTEFEAEIEAQLRENAPSPQLLAMTPPSIALFIIKQLASGGKTLLSELQSKGSSTKLSRRMGLALDLQESTFKTLYELLSLGCAALRGKQFAQIPESSCCALIIYTQQLLRTHLLAVEQFQYIKIDSEIRSGILAATTECLQLTTNELVIGEATKTISMCFGVFYRDSQEKLGYLTARLKDMWAGHAQTGLFKALGDKIFFEMARVDKMFPALELSSAEYAINIQEYLTLLVQVASHESQAALKAEPYSFGIIKLLEASQFALISHAAKDEFKDEWKGLLMHYTTVVLEECHTVNKLIHTQCGGSDIPDNLMEIINKTIPHILLELLLYGLMLSKLSLDFLAKILPALQNVMGSLSFFKSKEGVLTLGTAFQYDEYESTHNYADNAHTTHVIKLPNAKKYTLTFDTQCKTESGCDYLELFLDEEKTNKFARYEGENFPKEPVVVESPLLCFTFTSDGSVNYWGWKIEIKAEVEGSYIKKLWPETTKQAASMLLALISSKLITGEFEMVQEDEETGKILSNPLLMYGVHDKALKVVKEPEPLNESLVYISTTPGIGEKLKTALLLRTYSADVEKRVVKNEDIAVSLSDYVELYGAWEDIKFSDTPFLHEFIEGKGTINQQWEKLKKDAGVVGPATAIGGAIMDQAERAIFAVYISYFEVVESITQLLAHPEALGSTLKYIVRQANSIRGWAQQHKQKLMDSDQPEITYELISQNILQKCVFLLAAEYRLSLNELGIEKALKNLLTSVKQGGGQALKSDSKWLSVQYAVKSMSKLKGLITIKSSVEGSAESHQDITEILKVGEFVSQILESSISVQKLVESIEYRRTRAIARTVGFLCLSNLINMSPKQETPLIKSFGDSFRTKGAKQHYWQGLEATDPTLLKCVQSSFFGVYGLLQKELIKSKGKPFTIGSYNHYLAVLEAMSCPLKGVDAHLMLELQFSATLETLLNWAKGFLGEEVVNRPFLKDKCVSRLGVLEEHNIPEEQTRILIQEGAEDSPNMCLVLDYGGTDDPIIEFKLSAESEDFYEDAVGPVSINGATQYILIKRGPQREGLSYLTGLNEELAPTYTKYEDLIAEEPEIEKSKRENLKRRLCKSAWALFKLLMYSLVGSWYEANEAKKILTQELFMRVLFKELSWEPEVNKPKKPFRALTDYSTGAAWLGMNIIPKVFKKNPMQEWLRLFHSSLEGASENFGVLSNAVKSFVEKADPSLKGVLTPVDFTYIDKAIADTLTQCEENKNSKGEYDFFRYLNVLKGLRSDFPLQVQEYLESSKLWIELPNDFYEAAKLYDLSDITLILRKANELNNPVEENSVSRWLELFLNSEETPGIISKNNSPGDTPVEFKNKEGNLDFYMSVHAIMTEGKFSQFKEELAGFLEIYNDLPPSCAEIVSSKEEKAEYIASILWTLYGCMSSQCLSILLAREEYLAVLLALAFKSSYEKIYILALRLLMHVIPMQHSVQTLQHIWARAVDPDSDLISQLFSWVGRGAYWTSQPIPYQESLRFEYEALNLLNALYKVTRWRTDMNSLVFSTLTAVAEQLETGNSLSLLQIGVLKYVATLNPGLEDSEFVPLEMTLFRLKGASIAQGMITSLSGDNVELYSVVEDNKVTENVKVLERMVPLESQTLSAVFSPEEYMTLFRSLTRVWVTLQTTRDEELRAPIECIGTLRVLYQKLGFYSLSTLSYLAAELNNVDPDEVKDLMQLVLRHSRSTWHYSEASLKQINKRIDGIRTEIHRKEESKECPEEELLQEISQMNEEDQILATEFISTGLPARNIVACFKNGIKDLESIQNYKEEKNSPVKTKLIYKLNNIESLQTKDPSGTAEIYQNNMAQLVIANNSQGTEPKRATTTLPSSIFHGTESLANSITLLAAFEGQPTDNSLTCGLVFGHSTIGLSTASGTPSITVDGSPIQEWGLTGQVLVRIHAHANGAADIQIGKGKKVLSLAQPLKKAFNGVTLGKVGVFLNEGKRIDLVALEVYEGVYTGPMQSKLEKAKAVEDGKRYVRVKLKAENPDKLRLRLLGLDHDRIQELSNKYTRFSDMIKDALVDNFTDQVNTPKLDISQCLITGVQVVTNKENIPSGFEPVLVYNEGEFKELEVPGRKLLVTKKEVLLGGRVCVGFSAVENPFSYEEIGDLTATEDDRPNLVYVKMEVPSEKVPGLKEIIYVQAQSVHSVKVPHGFSLVTDKEGKAVNLAHKNEKSHYLFLAYKNTDGVLNCSITPFSSMRAKSSAFGLVDNLDAQPQDIDRTDYSGLSIVELYGHLFSAEESRSQRAGKTLFINIFKKTPEIFEFLALAGDFTKLLSFIALDLDLISPMLDKLLSDPSKQELHEKLLISITQVLLEQSIATTGTALKTITVESTHPYECSLDLDEAHVIPGARALRIEFAPNCNTESGCDILRFYERSGRSEELKSLSGEGPNVWVNFEVPGDTLHTYFHTDGSVVYWGYKFDIVPVGAGSSAGPVVDPAPYIWLLNKVSELEQLEGILGRLLSANFLQTLFMYALSCRDIERKSAVLSIFVNLLRGQKSVVVDDIVKFLWDEANSIYNESKKSNSPNLLLQALISLFVKLSDLYEFRVDKEWFIEFAELTFDMAALTTKGEDLDMLLFDRFKQKMESGMEQVTESAHPYTRKTEKFLLETKGSAFLNVVFSEDSKCDLTDKAFLTFDSEGKQSVSADTSAKAQSVKTTWSNDPKGADIEFSNENLSVTRTNSDGWGSALFSQSFSEGVVRITFYIDNDANAPYLYIGVFKEANAYNLTSCIGSGCENDAWSWKCTGEFNKSGSSTDGTGYSTGDDITLCLDFNEKTLVFLKNNEEVYTFSDLPEKVLPVICFGSSGQLVTIKSVEVLGTSVSELSKMSQKVIGDSAFLWFPVNVGYGARFVWKNLQGAASKLSDSQILKDNADCETLHDTGVNVHYGKHYIEFLVEDLPSGTVSLGLSTADSVARNERVARTLLFASSGRIGDQESAGFSAGDTVGCFYDAQCSCVKFYKNGVLVSTHEYSVEEEDEDLKLHFIAVLDASGQQVRIAEDRELPSDIDLFNVTETVTENWGFKVRTTPEFKGRNQAIVPTILSKATAEVREEWESLYLPTYKAHFISAAAEQLVIYLDEFSANKGLDVMCLGQDQINPSKLELVYYPELEKLEIAQMRELYELIKNFNLRVKEFLFMFNLHVHSAEKLSELQKVFIGSRSFIFFALKNGLLKELLGKTNSENRAEITVDRPKAMRHKARKDQDAHGQFSIFGQIYRALQSLSARDFRNSERIFKVNYRGEGSVDAGGPYNEVISNMCDELQSTFLRLFVQVQNNVHNMGENRDCWIVNSSATTQDDSELFLFLGKLMGVAIRTQNNLNLSLPPLFWKRLVFDSVDVRDLRAVDVCLVEILAILRNLDANAVTKKSFAQAYDERFTVKDSSGAERELVEGGAGKIVTFENAKEYAELVESFRLHEGQAVYDQIRRGLSISVPMDYLNLFSWRQVQTLVCGAPDINVDILKENTEYEGCGESDPHIVFFWEILREMQPKERSLFLKFVWGRSKLPAGKDWKHMKITRYSPPGQVNNYMPVSHTCFFTIDLPVYTTKDAMRRKLLYAITHCTAIDLDGAAGQGWEEEE